MKHYIRTLIPILLVLSTLVACDQGDAVIGTTASVPSKTAASISPKETSKRTTPASSGESPKTTEIIYWHPEVLWTDLSVGAEVETYNKTDPVYIGKYGVYDENGVRTEIAPDQKIAFALDVVMNDAFFGESYDSSYQSDAFRALVSEEAFHKYRGERKDLAVIEDWMEEQGFEVIRDHKRGNTRTMNDEMVEKHPMVILFFATEEQLATLYPPLPKTIFRVYGASVEEFAPEKAGQFIK